MSSGPQVIVKKGGFLAALCTGFFGFLTTTVVCATGLGVYTIHTFKSTGFDAAGLVGKVVETLPKWREAMPPAISDAFDDRRAPEYREQLDVDVKLVEFRRNHARALIEVTNNGKEIVSVLALRARVLDDRGLPTGSSLEYVVSPLAIDERDWPGPLLPGSTRTIERWLDASQGEKAVSEIVELRVSNKGSDGKLASAE